MTANTSQTSLSTNNTVSPAVPAVATSPTPSKPFSAITVDTASPNFSGTIIPFTPDALANGFSTLVGALVGAMLAYVTQRRFQRFVEHKNSLTAGHKLMFALLQQINTIILIQRDYVQAELNNPSRFLSIPATPQFDTTKNVLEIPELAFLLEKQDGRAILYDFYMAQENYLEALNQWNLRSTLHLEKVQPALAASNIKSGEGITEDQLKVILGGHLFGHILNSTDNCIETLRRAFGKLSETKVKAREYLVHRFKTKDFTDFDYPDTYGLTDERA